MCPQIPKKVIKEIHNTIKYVWEYDISQDYKKKLLLKEDTLKNSLYSHIRTRLGDLLEKYNIVIYTEFNTDKFINTGFRADMVIAQINLEKVDKEHLGNCIKNYISIIEIKFKSDFSNANDIIYDDYKKIKKYIESIDFGEMCHFYMATIWECHPNLKWWVDKETKWAKGKLTELNADLNCNEEMEFYISEH